MRHKSFVNESYDNLYKTANKNPEEWIILINSKDVAFIVDMKNYIVYEESISGLTLTQFNEHLISNLKVYYGELSYPPDTWRLMRKSTK